MSVKTSVSILSGDFANMSGEVKRMEIAGTDMIHCDVMDGVFVPNLTFGPKMVGDVRKCTKLPLDVHLMIIKPENYIKKFIDSGSDLLTFHIEATDKIKENLELIRSANVKSGLAICPETPIEECYQYLDLCDIIIVMGVHPGFSGQSYIAETTDKIIKLKAEIAKRNLNVLVEMDGGANESNVKLLRDSGCDILVSGSCAFSAADPKNIFEVFRGER